MTPTREEWQPVVGYEGAYEVSDHGRVRSVDRVIIDSRGRRQPWTGRVRKLRKNRLGRWTVGLRDEQRKWHNLQVAPLVLAAFVGPRPSGLECCHNNGISTDDRLVNLRWDTRSSNMLDKVKHGTHHNAIKTHCLRGHPLASHNLVISMENGSRKRHCRACNRACAYRKRHGGDMQQIADAIYERIRAA